jgi:polysaccharide export outer membrane protein
VAEYRLREGDIVAIYYLRTREEFSRPYELQVGDRIRVESLTAGADSSPGPAAGETPVASDDIARELVVQPDGTITLPMVGQVRATRRTIQSLRDELGNVLKNGSASRPSPSRRFRSTRSWKT